MSVKGVPGIIRSEVSFQSQWGQRRWNGKPVIPHWFCMCHFMSALFAGACLQHGIKFHLAYCCDFASRLIHLTGWVPYIRLILTRHMKWKYHSNTMRCWHSFLFGEFLNKNVSIISFKSSKNESIVQKRWIFRNNELHLLQSLFITTWSHQLQWCYFSGV